MNSKDKKPGKPKAAGASGSLPHAGPTEAGEQHASLSRRQRAEMIFLEMVERSQEHLDSLSPETLRQVYHELRVHQIELELQNAELRRAQEELEAVQARYFDLYDMAPAGYVTVSEQGLILEANLTAATLLGVGRPALVKQPISRFILPEDQDIYYALHKKLLATREPQMCELRMMKPDGPAFWTHFEAAAAKGAGVGGMCRIMINDITGRRREDDIRSFLARTSSGAADEPFFSALARYLAGSLGADFICIDRLEGEGLDARTLAVWCDGHFEDNVTYALQDTPCGEVVGKEVCCFPASVCQFFPRDQVLKDLRAESYIGVTLWSHSGQPIGLIAAIARRPLANRPQAEATLKLVAERASGELERLEADEKLQRSEVRFRSYFDLPLHGRCVTSPDKGWIEVNDRLCEILGYSREEICRMTWAEMTHPDDLPADIAQFDRLLAGEIEQYKLEKRFIRKDGTIVWTEISVGCVRKSDGTVDHVICVIDDITERTRTKEALKQALERAEAAARAKAEFLSVMSHELRTPLNAVLGFAELLADSPLDDGQKECLGTINASGNLLLSIVNDILDFSSIESGRMKLESAAFATAELVKSADLAVRKAADDKGLAFRCEVVPGVPEQITGDERRICQILINLLGNAVKFTPAGSVVLRVAPAVDGGRRFLDFSVKDTGIGISSEALGSLFLRFTQADSSTNRQFGGTGLGLAISKHLANAMGGSITVASDPGNGSTFTFRLPLESPADGTRVPPLCQDQPSRILPIEQKEAGGGTPVLPASPVLVVDDDRASSVIAGKMLQRLGYRVEFAASGDEALKAFAPGKFFAILMDMAMPVMDGLEAARQIREVEAAANGRVPIIAFTANVMPGDRESCLAAGMDDFLAKPCKKDELAEKLARAALAGDAR